jgi:hypothetical protein
MKNFIFRHLTDVRYLGAVRHNPGTYDKNSQGEEGCCCFAAVCNNEEMGVTAEKGNFQ